MVIAAPGPKKERVTMEEPHESLPDQKEMHREFTGETNEN
jgi:hypothetical protein